jgi:MFS family permease
VWGGLSFHLAVIAMLAYNVAITADSGALTAGTIAIARPYEQGATLAIYSLVGFGGGAVGPLLVGGVLDLGGGFTTPHAWYAGFAAMAAGSVLAAIAVSIGSPPEIASRAAGIETGVDS